MNKLIPLLFFCFALNAQQIKHDPANYTLQAYLANEEINLDAEANEMVWQRAQKVGDFWQKFPTSDRKSDAKTEVRVAYDDKFLYFFIEAYDSTNNYIAPSLKRDQSLREQDGITVVLDPVNKQANGFGFGCTPNNVQSEYQYANGFNELSFAWDNKWFSEAKRLKDRYVIEMAIPFKTLRYNASNTIWGVNIIRSDRKNNEFSTWTNIPVQFTGIDLGYMGELHFEGKLTQQKGNVSIIPYVAANVSSDKQNDLQSTTKVNAGLDAKIAVSPSLNLDLTVNPDFSQVEVDQQVTNLTRFSIFFPERRTFFLENSDIFSEFAAPPFRPFFSRRIGLDENAQPIPILFGARLSGNLTEKTRIGVMNMQTAAKDDFAAQNYTAASVHQRFGSRSVIKGYFLNRDATGEVAEAGLSSLDKYGRNLGGELNLIDKAGVNQFWAGYHHSFKEGLNTENNFYQFGAGHFGKIFEGFIDVAKFGKNYYADQGFINRIETYAQTGFSYNLPDTTIRAGFTQMYNENNLSFRPKDKKLVLIQLGQSNYVVWFADGSLSDRAHSVLANLRFRNTSGLYMEYLVNHDNLRYYFPLPQNKPLKPGTYDYGNLTINYTGDTRKNFILNGGVVLGTYYNAQLRQYNLSLLMRKQPYVNMTLSAQFNDLIFPEEFGRTKLWLVGPRVEATFSNKLFWTTFLQFNTQVNNFNINSRIQYRYGPMSDFFLVYSDNYFTDTFSNKNRALIFKWNYWLSL
ncbi:DUF5916 domain-containing protein [Jiulongibacter sp. NS-SX5]|uniref:DUF5916 domain-containing protein n=1 Tax=Jiulongibacter sp. NS-SX5 TaxID=3463854 RepID=UPI004059C433